MKNENRDIMEQIANLPITGETGAGVPEYKHEEIKGDARLPSYKEESFLQKIKENWVIIIFILGLMWGFVTQVWTPLVELRQRVGVLERDFNKHDSFLEELKRSTFFQGQQPDSQLQKPTPILKESNP